MKRKAINPARSPFTLLRQICNFIPTHEVSKLARTTGVETQSRTFKPWSIFVGLSVAGRATVVGRRTTVVNHGNERHTLGADRTGLPLRHKSHLCLMRPKNGAVNSSEVTSSPSRLNSLKFENLPWKLSAEFSGAAGW
jgi:hypothetical protein